MHINTLFNQGTASVVEDALVMRPLGANQGFFGVIDGVSGSYNPREGPRTFRGMSGGQLAVATIIASFFNDPSGKTLEEILVRANDVLGNELLSYGLSMEDSALLPGASFAITEVGSEKVTIITGGDCLAVCQIKGNMDWASVWGWASPNITFASEKEQNDLFKKLLEKHGGDRQQVWDVFLPFMMESYRKYRNKPGGYSELNGQPQFKNYWQRFVFQRNDLQRLILFSDGLVPFEATETPELLAQRVIKDYSVGGLQGVLKRTREELKARKHESHIDAPEATAVVIEL